MKNYIYTVFVLLAVVGCKQDKQQVEQKETDLSTITSETSFPETSIFNIDHKWLNQFSDTVQLSDLGGKPIVMAMIYTTCNFSCPRIVADMREVESLVPEDKVADINFVLISIDPEVDQPDTLKAFMHLNQMDEDRWTLLTGTKDQIQDLAAVLGFKYKKSTLMDYAHSNLITEFDQQGNWLHQTEGFGGNKQEIVDVLMGVLE